MTEQGGILCIDKPEGFTSFDVVAKLRGIARERRVGHAGTLDPMATGVLPLFFGRATKACDILPRQDKRYLASFKLGVTTDTQDITGTVLSEQTPDADEARVRAAAAGLVGDIMQTPPMYSAVRVNGQRLYELARRGVEVERAARPVTVYSIDFTACDVQANTFTIDVHCSKGTYIRTLIADIGAALGCGAVMTALRRTMACLGAACVFLPLVNPVIDRLVRLGGGTVERLHGFWFRPDFTRWAENWYFNENVLLLLWLALAAAAALCALRALLRRREA